LGAVAPKLLANNPFAWCVVTPTSAEDIATLAAMKTSDGKPLPECPAAFLDESNRFEAHFDDATGWAYTGLNRWATRGAINAGLSVFIYVDWLVGGDQPIPPRYNECELLKP